MSLRERIEWVFRMGLLVFILAAAAFLSAVTAMRFAIQGREVTMPNLVGKSSARCASHPAGARAAIKSRRPGLQRSAGKCRRAAKSSGRRAHEGFAECARRPQPGPAKCDHSLAGGRIPSRSPHPIAAGRPATGRSDRVRGSGRPVRHHFAADPAPGTRAASPRVDLLVAQAEPPAAYIMPWLVGMSLPDADRLLTSAGLKLSKTTYAPSPQWPKGAVTEQTPDRVPR